MAGLAKANITCGEPSAAGCSCNVNLDVQFNPKELTVEKSVSWTSKNAHKEDPSQEFKEPQSSSLSCTLYFDTYETKKDVYATYVQKLEKLVLMDQKLGRPPLAKFVWGKMVFTGVVDKVSQKYTMFLEDGTRARCEVTYSMKSASSAVVSSK